MLTGSPVSIFFILVYDFIKTTTMSNKLNPNEFLSFVVDHEVILATGGSVMIWITIFLFLNRKKVTLQILSEGIVLLLLSWWVFYLIIQSGSNSIITLAAGISILLPALIFGLIKTNNTEQ